jgi:pilus assembly protein Flp/PilA
MVRTVFAGFSARMEVRDKSKSEGVRSMLHRATESGQGLIEYGLAIVLVAVIAMAIMVMLGPAISDLYSNIVAAI